MNNHMNCKRMGYLNTSGGGLIHNGSLRAVKRLKEVNNTAFETIFVRDLKTDRASLYLYAFILVYF